MFTVLGPDELSVWKRVRLENGKTGWIDTLFVKAVWATAKDHALVAMHRMLAQSAPGEVWVLTGVCSVSPEPFDLNRRLDAETAATFAKFRWVFSGRFTILGSDGATFLRSAEIGEASWYFNILACARSDSSPKYSGMKRSG